MSRADRLYARDYRRLPPGEREAVDVLRYGLDPSPAERGRAKTTLGWRRTAEETVAYASQLLEGGMIMGAVAVELRVEVDHLRRLLKRGQTLEIEARNLSVHAEKSGLTGRERVVTHPGVGAGSVAASVYGGDGFAYDFEAALERVAMNGKAAPAEVFER